ncbi:MAG TPA: transposase [Alphaproteobacteria bacterium]|nr:transposase [Alphaproteobacteria bacterium]
MARLARAVAPGMPHHVTQRGNRRQKTFFDDGDYAAYKALLAEGCKAAGVEVWAYCLMPNHVHLILVPGDEDGLRAAIAEAHRRYTRMINARKGWTGFLWQGRFASCPMDEAHTLAAARYAEQNPVRARLTLRAQDWPWSSAKAHLRGRDDGLVAVQPLLDRVADWKAFLGEPLDVDALEAIRSGERTGRPRGPDSFVKHLEKALGRTLAKAKPGPKPAVREDA